MVQPHCVEDTRAGSHDFSLCSSVALPQALHTGKRRHYCQDTLRVMRKERTRQLCIGAHESIDKHQLRLSSVRDSFIL